MKRALSIVVHAASLAAVSGLITELHRLDTTLDEMRLRVSHLEGYVDRLKPASDYWWLRQR